MTLQNLPVQLLRVHPEACRAHIPDCGTYVFKMFNMDAALAPRRVTVARPIHRAPLMGAVVGIFSGPQKPVTDKTL